MHLQNPSITRNYTFFCDQRRRGSGGTFPYQLSPLDVKKCNGKQMNRRRQLTFPSRAALFYSEQKFAVALPHWRAGRQKVD